MRKFFLLVLALQCAFALLLKDTLVHAVEADDDYDDDENSAPPSFWDFVVKDGAGTPVPLHDFRDAKAILVVNVASECGYTDQNYKELQALYEKYHASGLQILAFPCNQFGAQEPHDNKHILQFVQDQYKVSFPIFAKIDVNGDDQHPLFDYLKTALPGFLTNDIKWNFTKFLVINGVPTKRYSTVTSPFAIESDIVEALGLAAPRDETEL